MDRKIGTRIAEQRKKIGITQNRLAEKLMVSNKTISRWESNLGNPSFEFIPKLCEILDCSADYLFLGVETFEKYKKIKTGIYVDIGTNQRCEMHSEDLTMFPHLLAIGETGTGKSTLFHSFIVDILNYYKKEEVQLALIDCKRVEFGIYKEMPNLYMPLAQTIESALEMLEKLVIEINDRCQKFLELKIKNIRQYNNISKERMPYIVVFIDELAELKFNKRVMDLVVHLLRISRAMGVHLIIGTQRLKSDTLTWEIREFCPTKICFKVNIKEQSEEFFSFAGGEELKGHGEMLFYKEKYKRLLKLQGKNYTGTSINSFLKEKGLPYREISDPDPEFIAFIEKALKDPKYINLLI